MVRYVNLISEISAELLERQNPGFNDYVFTYSEQAIPADFHVYYGAPKHWPTRQVMQASGLVLLEPPEIERYPLEALSSFQFVLSPSFKYISGLQNHTPGLALLPWRIGVAHEKGMSTPTLSASEIRQEALPEAPLLTAIVSGKTRTKAQRARLELVRYFQENLPNFQVFGRDSDLIPDKADAHRLGIFHLAVENSRHSGYSTEKLIDPILMGNHVFYWGDPVGLAAFGRASVTPINVYRPRSALKTVLGVMSHYDPTDRIEGRLRNREKVLATFNFHTELVTLIEEITKTRGGHNSDNGR